MKEFEQELESVRGSIESWEEKYPGFRPTMQGFGYDEEKRRWFDSYNLINHATGEQAYYVYHYPEDYRAAPSWVDNPTVK